MEKLTVKLPFGKGRLLWVPVTENADILAGEVFATQLFAKHVDHKGRTIRDNNHNSGWDKNLGYELGSGLVTHMGVTLLAQDSQTLVNGNTFFNLKYHGSGTGTTAATGTDYQLQTANGTTATADTTHTRADATPNSTIQSVATLAYASTLAITEWGLFNSATLTQSVGTPFTATSANTATVTGTPLTTNAFQGYTLRAATTTVHGLIYTNTTSVFTLATNPGWFNDTGGAAGSTPSGTSAFTELATMWDHKVFSAINVVNGDSIQFTYTLTINSGG